MENVNNNDNEGLIFKRKISKNDSSKSKNLAPLENTNSPKQKKDYSEAEEILDTIRTNLKLLLNEKIGWTKYELVKLSSLLFLINKGILFFPKLILTS